MRLAAPARFTTLLGEVLEPRLPLAIAAELLADINRLPAGVQVVGEIEPVVGVAFFAGVGATQGESACGCPTTCQGTSPT
jgi:hypothetical protein